MKKKFGFIILFLTCVIGEHAQWFSIGAKAGYSTTLEHSMSYRDVFDVKSNLQNGFHAGLYMRMGRTWYAQPEVLFNYYNYSSTLDYGNNNVYKDKKYHLSFSLNTLIFLLNLSFLPKRWIGISR